MNYITRPFMIGVVFFALCTDSFAGRPRAQMLVGVVQSIDLPSQEITVDFQKFQVTKQTRFIEDSLSVKPTTLKPGDKVKLHYRSPLIGKKFATKVTWPATPPKGGSSMQSE